jgi:uncharacterized protein (UPF0332 family)
MIFPVQWLDLAEELLRIDSTRPRNSSLRRAVSTAYYALFHLLVQAAAQVQAGGLASPVQRDLVAMLTRWFTHKQMAETCACFSGPKLAGKAGKVLQASVDATPSSELREVARAFVDLQQERHDADYDLSKRFTRQEVELLLTRARQAFEDWQKAAADPLRPLFLLLLLTGERVIVDRT